MASARGPVLWEKAQCVPPAPASRSLQGGKELNPASLTSSSPSIKKQHPSPFATFLGGKRASARAFCWVLILVAMGEVLLLT